MRLHDGALLEEISAPISISQQSGSIVIETNNPNPFKAMHIGHAMNSIVADTIANLLALRSSEVHRVSYHGDVGLHVGKSMYSLLLHIDGDISKLHEVVETERNSFMSRIYAEGSAAYKTDTVAKQKIDELSKQSFTRDDALYAEVYDLCKAWSLAEIDKLVQRMGNVPIEKRYLESHADARGVTTVKAHVPDVFKESDGAIIFEGSKYGAFDNAFVTSSGLGLYGARDLGLMQLKDEDFHAKESYIVTAIEQKDYFKGVIAAAELCLPQLKDVTVNISTGTLKLTTGKMSSRDGDVVEIAWLFETVAQAITARGGEPSDEMIAGALRYQFLKSRVGSDIVFDVNEAVSLQGNTGSYLQYAHARAKSILAKTTVEPMRPTQLDAAERSLVRMLSQMNEVVQKATTDLMPHIICTYLYELAQAFNRFYESSRIIGDEREAERLFLVRQYATTLAHGMSILGIHAPDQM